MLFYRGGIDDLITAMMLIENGSPWVEDLIDRKKSDENGWAGRHGSPEAKATAIASNWFREIHGVWPKTEGDVYLAGECLFAMHFERGLNEEPVPSWADLSARMDSSMATTRGEARRLHRLTWPTSVRFPIETKYEDGEGDGVQSRVFLDYILTRRELGFTTPRREAAELRASRIRSGRLTNRDQERGIPDETISRAA